MYAAIEVCRGGSEEGSAFPLWAFCGNHDNNIVGGVSARWVVVCGPLISHLGEFA